MPIPIEAVAPPFLTVWKLYIQHLCDRDGRSPDGDTGFVVAGLHRLPGLQDIAAAWHGFLDSTPVYDPEKRKAMEAHADQVGGRVPWDQYRDLGLDSARRLVLCRNAATAITDVAAMVVPAPYRTPAYEAALTRDRAAAVGPPPLLANVSGPAPNCTVLLDEAVLRRWVGGKDVLAGQLHHLLDIIDTGQATVRVLPYDTAAPPICGDGAELVIEGAVLSAHIIHGAPVYESRSVPFRCAHATLAAALAAALDADASRSLIAQAAQHLR
ncbi:Scr1 family TA system antitoxin-like transcriptional regulator [Streptomyces sp. NPDC002073]